MYSGFSYYTLLFAYLALKGLAADVKEVPNDDEVIHPHPASYPPLVVLTST